MIRSIKIVIGIFLLALISQSCVKDGMDECPEGDVRINLFVEKFRNRSQNPLDDYEEDFTSRVSQLRYFLYRENTLVQQGIIDRFTKSTSPSYTFDLPKLEYGKYNMVIVANSKKTALTGDPSLADNLVLTYPGCADTEDFFTATFPFTVDSNTAADYNVGLLRTHGVIRYTFVNMPSDISDIEVVMQNVSSEKWVTGDYKKVGEASQKYVIVPLEKNAAIGDYVIGTFPSLTGQKSAYYLQMYRNNQPTPYMRQLITDTLTVRRNQLLDIAVTFNKGDLSFVVDLDSDWDGSSSGGETGIE